MHIPFCKQACHYCDFHFSVSVKSAEPMAAAIAREAELRAEELKGQTVKTLYFGGGTPSLMTKEQLGAIIQSIRGQCTLAEDLEFTFEANPDDLKPGKTAELRALGANRLSIGLQSFDDDTLRWMNRAHNAAESLTCVKTAKAEGFD
ncbi:MAG: radical SAM protein, partial [Cryomorphaceae bacterium]